jgi:hypothetical protein
LLKDGNGRQVGCEFVFFKALIVDRGEEERAVGYISSLFLFSCLQFYGVFYSYRRGESRVWRFFIKK